VISDTAQSAQDTAQCKLDHALLDDAKAVKLATKRGPSDDAPIPSLSAILQEVQNTTICLMRLSRPLLNDHLHHQTTTQHCDKDNKHHISHLQRLIPHATLTVLKRLSKSICARRLGLLRMNSHWGRLDDVTFLLMVLRNLVSVSDEAVRTSSTGSSVQAHPGRLR
jgi:hypothetical protein